MQSLFIPKIELFIYAPKSAPSGIFATSLCCSSQKPDCSLCSHRSTQPSVTPSCVPSKHLTTYFLHGHQLFWTTITCYLEHCSILSSAFTLVSLSHPHLPPLGDSYHRSQSKPSEAKWEHVLPSPETFPWLSPHSKQKPQLLLCRHCNNKALMISSCYFFPIIPFLFSFTVTLCLFL